MYSSPYEWKPESKDGKIKYTWEDLLRGRRSQFHAFRTQCFNEMFVKYRKSWFTSNDLLTNPNLYNKFKNVLYKSKRNKANQIHDLFRKELYYVNQQWYWAVDIDQIPASTCF